MHLTPDNINGLYEGIGGLFLWKNVHRLYKDKIIRGVSILSTTFFASWGVWNLYYYPYLNQWFSFSGGCIIVAANVVWVGQMIYYTWREKYDSRSI